MRGSNPEARANLVADINRACRDKGFFQLTNTAVSLDLQRRILAAAADFFSLPNDEKAKCDFHSNKHYRGYEGIGSQNLEPGAEPDCKESIYLGQDLPLDHPRVVRGDYRCGPNLYPEALGKPFQNTCMEYFNAVQDLARDIMRVLALGLGLEEAWFDDFANTDATATLRLIHYPPSTKTNDRQRGAGAHRDFGCITILLQDEVGGLQVQDERTGDWLDVKPTPGAFVVNLGNAMMRWTNHHYTSNTHRVMNFSPKDRYSVPFFFNGNARHMLETIPGCEQRRDTSDKAYGPPLKADAYGPIQLQDFLHEQLRDSYARAKPVAAN